MYKIAIVTTISSTYYTNLKQQLSSPNNSLISNNSYFSFTVGQIATIDKGSFNQTVTKISSQWIEFFTVYETH